MLLASTCPGCRRSGPAPCPRCRAQLVPVGFLTPPPGLHASLAGFAYEGPGRALVGALKYRNQRAIVPWAAEVLATTFALVDIETTVVTWAPTSRVRRRDRGYDQARLLARATSRRLGVPVRSCVARQGSAAQTGRSRAERLAGPTFRPTTPMRGATVVVVDDVVTTGATLSAVAHALHAGGAAWVIGLCLAATPSRGSSPGPPRPKELISQPEVKN